MRAEKVSKDFGLYRRLLWQARACWPHLGGMFLLSLLSTPLALLTPLPLKIAVDSVIGSRPVPDFLKPVLPDAATRSHTTLLVAVVVLLIAVSLLTHLQDLASYVLSTYTGERLLLSFRTVLFEHVQRLSLGYHDSKGTADSTYRIQYDASSIRDLALFGVTPFVTAGFTLCGMVYVTMRIDWQLALVALAVAPMLGYVTSIARRRLRRGWREAKQLESSALSVVQEVLTSLRVVKAFGQEERERDRFLDRSAAGMRKRIKLAALDGTLNLLYGLAFAAGTAAVLFIGVRHVQGGTLTLGSLLLVMGYLTQLYAPLETISKSYTRLQSAFTGAERAFYLLDQEPDVSERPHARRIERTAGAVTFQSVSFAYGDRPPVLRDLSFEVGPGTRAGISGATGAGKTTLVSLLTRFYDPTAGQILLDGVDLRDYKLSDLRNQFGIVLQEPVLFSTSIAENISYGQPGAHMSEIVAAAEAANAHDFISRLPEGYGTGVGERGMQLSGGERQRISLARAFLKDAPILILDEPTSSVDMKTEAGIMEAMDRLMEGRTTLMIAHRLGTLENCDLRLELAEGRLEVATSAEPTHAARSESRTPAVRDRAGRRQGAPADHAAARAWASLDGSSLEPSMVEALKDTANSGVYRLEFGTRASTIIAKRGSLDRLRRERFVYEDVLPSLPLRSLRCHGFVEEYAGHAWLFLEDAGRDLLQFDLAEDRALAAAWLGVMHMSASRSQAAALLPARGPAYYLTSLRAAREAIAEALHEHSTDPDRKAILSEVVSQCDLLEAHWPAVERACAAVPETLVHGDFTEKNLHVRGDGSKLKLLPTDWKHAGWGVPAVDLPRVNAALYSDFVRRFWDGLDVDAVHRLATVGRLFRFVAATHWASLRLPYPPIERPVSQLQAYSEWLRPMLAEAGVSR